MAEPDARTPGCCWRASCCVCRRTCAGWRPANGTGPVGGTDMNEHGRHARWCAPAGCARSTASGEGLVRAVDGVDLDVAAGETVAVMGPSGCGKSTLLHLLGGLDRPSAGEVWLAGRRVDRLSERALAQLRRDAVGFVFQAFHLMDELTAQENVELPALLAGRSPRRSPAAGRGAAGAGRAGGPGRHLPSALSGRPAPAGRDRPGARQRAAGGPGGRADRQPRQRGHPGGAAPVREPARGRADAGHRHPRLRGSRPPPTG